MLWRFRGLFLLSLLLPNSGCGGSSPEKTAATAPQAASRRVHFVGFDSSKPLNHALKAGKIEGLVVQNPLKMGELGVRTLVAILEKKEVEPRVDTGEVLITPENLSDPKIAVLMNPPQVENISAESLSGGRKKTWRVIVIPKGTTHEFWKTIHAGAGRRPMSWEPST